ncbi:hypothetical protein [Bdellovibrio sp. HCB337]|uniref:hypothetical protein n=1 Tax=Bdellovibrio sp. HCB337 TaxID=3394358 RepID=UPI0039A553DF
MRNFLLNALRGLIALLLVLLLAPVAFGQPVVSCEKVLDNSPILYVQPGIEVAAKQGGFSPVAYYTDKLREIKELDGSAPYAVALRGLIMTRATKVTKELIPLPLLKTIHPITRGAAIEKLEKRTKALQQLAASDDGYLHLNEATLNTVMPSKNSMRAIRADNGDVVVFDGNGRLVAIQNAFADKQQYVTVEVEMHHSKSKLLQKVLKKVRTMRNVLED